MKTNESWSALLFLAMMAAAAVFCWFGFYQESRETAASAPVASEAETSEQLTFLQQVEAFTGNAESNVNAVLDRGHLFIQLYGGIQRLAGRRVMEDTDSSRDVVKLSDGTLTFINDSPGDPEKEHASFSRLFRELSERNIPFLYVQAPNKLAPDDDRLPAGVADRSNEYADDLLAMLQTLGIDTLDLRKTFLEANGDWDSYFFATDHHWTPEGAFLACRSLCGVLREDYGFSINETYTDPENFTRTVYRDWFLGSLGKRVGSLYGGVDDITAWSPSFHTLFTYEVYSQDILRTGDFDHTLMFYDHIAEKDWYNGNPYTLYSGGDYPMAHIINHLNPDGPRILLVRDSYSCALAPFLALNCSELSTFDLRYFSDSDRLLTYVDWLKPDLVIMMYTAGAVRLDQLLRF